MSARSQRGAIGSVLPFPLDEVGGQADHSLWSAWTRAAANTSAFRTARGALRALLAAAKITRLWLPAYICEAMASAAPPGCEVRFYDVGPGLPLQGLAPFPGDAVVGVDYFGRSAASELRDMARARPDVLWIEDRAQALAPDAPQWGDVLLFSPRKLIGVADGGLLASDRPLPSPVEEGATDWRPEVGRYEDPGSRRPQRWGPAFQAREAGLDAAPEAMSALSRSLLGRIAAGPLGERRRANGEVLRSRLGDYALWPEDAVDWAPMAFPVRVRNTAMVVAELAAERLFCARHWASLPSPPDDFPAAHRLAGELLSLPCDHRYDAEDMERLAEAVRRLAVPAGHPR